MGQKEAAGKILHLVEVVKRGRWHLTLGHITPLASVPDRNYGHHHQYVCIDQSLKVHAKVLKLSPLLSKNELLTIIADHNLTYVYIFRKYYVYS